ncbi:hypothetical protein N7523_011146 [Penicillium sp. IBT 18751x]|nr:hypothetical protein N7523_011146 [Penicillium sp. IBT 18751x]
MSVSDDKIPAHYPVAVVGGSSVGLMSSILLSLQGISHILFERFPHTAIHPKATNLNQRSMELLFKIGVGEQIVNMAAPTERVANTAWYTSLGEETGTWRGRQIAKRATYRAKDKAETLRNGSFAPSCIIPQVRLDPVLKRRAEDLAPGRVCFGHEVLDTEEKSDHVQITVRERETGQVYKVTATWVIGADGGRTLPGKIGAVWKGEANMAEMVSVHLRAPLSTYHPDPSVYISWFLNPELGGSINTGFLYPLGPWPNKLETEEWVFGFALHGEEKGKRMNEADARARLVKVLKLESDVLSDVEILSIGRWYLNARVVDRYRSQLGRIFLVGDAAHKVPPWGAFGLNSGLSDAHNLVWKLARAVKSPEENWNALLDSYEVERKPIAEFVAKTSLTNIRTHGGRIDAALGVRPDASTEANIRQLEMYFHSASADSDVIRKGVQDAIASLDGEFNAYGCHHGWFYPSVDLKGEGNNTCHDGQSGSNGELKITHYCPSTIPGHHLPHSWLVDSQGTRRSTTQLVSACNFVLFAQDSAWASLSAPDLEVILIGDANGWRDDDGRWNMQCGVGPSGAVLVRPDGIVTFRFQDNSCVKQPGFSHVFETLLREMQNLQEPEYRFSAF